MTASVRQLVRFLVRLAILWIVDAVALGLTSRFVPGLSFEDALGSPAWLWAVAAAFALGVINLLVRPLVLLLARPLGWIAILLVSFLANALALMAAAALLQGFQITGLAPAIVGAIVFAGINVVLTNLLEIDEDGSYYQNRIEKAAAGRPFRGASDPGVGLAMVEIDGLSYHHLRKALEDGVMPTVQAMIEEEGYVLSRVDCGLPSQTSACQAGILFGDNSDIPAFRWFDKSRQRLFVSGSDAAELNARYAGGSGLLRGGSSIGNLLNGDAEKSLLTVADLRSGSSEERKRRAEDMYLVLLNPYFLTRTLALFFGNVGRELWEGWRQRRQDVQPRMNRLAHFYPFVRAGTSVVVRDLGAQLAVLDILRGAPSLYVTWPGYDEVAHHSGPWTTDAFGELKRFDAVVAKLRRTIQDKAPRPYDLILLSDHGQSFGATFRMRYGVTLKGLIESLLPAGTTVSQTDGGDTGIGPLAAIGGELANVSEQGVGGAPAAAVARRSQRLIDKGVAEQPEEAVAEPAQVTAYGSGNLAQVYFDLHPRKITLAELEAAYPGMVDALVGHEGLGLVCGYDDDGVPVALGKGGRRDLHTGEVLGDDPLAPYAPADGPGAASLEKRVWQVRRVMDFPSAGDLMVISTVYPDGTVAALEELIGNHGGMGGEQTDAFLLHPPEIAVPDTRNSTDLYDILNARRGGAPREVAVAPDVDRGADAWSLDNLRAGLADVRVWLGRALRALVLDAGAYSAVARDARMTGPAAVIALSMLTLTSVARTDGVDVTRIVAHWATWLVQVAAVFGAGRLLTKRGTFTRTFRALGFAQSVHVLQLAALIGPLASAVNALAVLLGFFAVWMGAAQAHETRGWRTLALPVLAVAVLVLSLTAVVTLTAGVGLTVESVLQSIGVSPE